MPYWSHWSSHIYLTCALHFKRTTTQFGEEEHHAITDDALTLHTRGAPYPVTKPLLEEKLGGYLSITFFLKCRDPLGMGHDQLSIYHIPVIRARIIELFRQGIEAIYIFRYPWILPPP